MWHCNLAEKCKRTAQAIKNVWNVMEVTVVVAAPHLKVPAKLPELPEPLPVLLEVSYKFQSFQSMFNKKISDLCNSIKEPFPYSAYFIQNIVQFPEQL